jgi:hypothetical protein
LLRKVIWASVAATGDTTLSLALFQLQRKSENRQNHQIVF